MAQPPELLRCSVMETVLLVAVLGAATAFGVWRRRTDGRIQVVGAGEPAGPGSVVAQAGTATSTASGESGSGALQAGDQGLAAGPPPSGAHGSDDSEPLLVDGQPLGPADHAAIPAEDVLTAAEIGADLGERATLVQFSSAFCQPCRVTRLVLGEVAGIVPGVAHVEIDAEAHLDLVRTVDVTRTPTVLFLDRAGRIRRRATGAPRRQDVLQALAEIV